MADGGAEDRAALPPWRKKIGDRWRQDQGLRHLVIAFVIIISVLQYKELVRPATAAALSTQQQSEQDMARDTSAQFAKGVALLAKVRGNNTPYLAARISGIYALGSLAKANEGEYRKQVMQTLVDYIKNNAQITATNSPLENHANLHRSIRAKHLGEDVKLAFALLKNMDNWPNNPYINRNELSFHDANFYHLQFERKIEWIDGVDLSNAKLEYSNFWLSKLNRANLRGAKLNGANLRGAELHGAKLQKAKFHGADLREAKLHSADLFLAEFHGANLREAELYGADLRGAELHGAEFQKAKFHDADLREAKFHSADLFLAEFHGANLRKTEFHGAELSSVKFHGADLREAEFHGADLRKAEFHGANLRSAQFNCANLIWTEFHGADLRKAEFNGANLRVAEFHGADLRLAKFDFGYLSALRGTYVNLIGTANITMDDTSIADLFKILKSSNLPKSKIDTVLHQCKYSPTFDKERYKLKNVWHDQDPPLSGEMTLDDNFDWQGLPEELASLYGKDAESKEKYSIFLRSLLRNFSESTHLKSSVDTILENDPELREVFNRTSAPKTID